MCGGKKNEDGYGAIPVKVEDSRIRAIIAINCWAIAATLIAICFKYAEARGVTVFDF